MSIRRAGTARTIGPATTLNTEQPPALQTAQAADSPLGHWLMQETSGTVMADASGNGHDGTYVSAPTLGAAAISGMGHYSASTPGAGYATVATGAWMDTASFTLEVLCYPTNVAGTPGIMGRFNTGYWTWGAGQLGSYLNAVNHTGGGALSNNTPYLLGLRIDAGVSVSFFKNGEKVVNDGSGGATNTWTGQTLYLLQSSGGYSYVGRQSFAAYYGTALSDARMLAHAQAAGLAA